MSKTDEWRRLAEKDVDPEWWPSQLEIIEQGGTLEALAEVVAVRYTIFRAWIRGNAEREISLANAEREGKARKMERVLQAAFNTALAPCDEPVKRSDALRAIELLLKPSSTIALNSDRTPSGITIRFVESVDGKPK